MKTATPHPSDHQPVQEQYRARMKAIAKGIDEHLNGRKAMRSGTRKVGFALLIFPFTEGETMGPNAANQPRVNYMSNADRADMLTAMKEFIARAEGRMQESGNG